MLFNAIFLTLFVLTWVILGGLPWLGWSLRRRAHGAIWALPFALLGGAGGGVLVPLLGLDNGLGIGVSMVTAVAGGALLTAAAYWTWDAYALGRRFRRFAVPASLTGTLSASDGLHLIASDPRAPKPGRKNAQAAGREGPPSIDSEERERGTPHGH